MGPLSETPGCLTPEKTPEETSEERAARAHAAQILSRPTPDLVTEAMEIIAAAARTSGEDTVSCRLDALTDDGRRFRWPSHLRDELSKLPAVRHERPECSTCSGRSWLLPDTGNEAIPCPDCRRAA
jgi:hypothetical protein